MSWNNYHDIPQLSKTLSAFLSTQNSEYFETRTNSAKIPENPEIIEFPKNETFNRKFLNFREESQVEREFTHKVVCFSGNFGKCSSI